MRALKPRARARLFLRFKDGESLDDLRIAYQLPELDVEQIVRGLSKGTDHSAMPHLKTMLTHRERKRRAAARDLDRILARRRIVRGGR